MWIAAHPLFVVTDDKMPPLQTWEASAEGYITTHPIKAAGMAALCRVFSFLLLLPAE